MGIELLCAIVLALLVGIWACFSGYRFFLILLPIWGFFAGLWLGAYTVTAIFGTGFLATVSGLVVGIIVGVIGAVLSYLFYMVGVAIIAGWFGAALASGIMTAIGFDSGLVVTLVAIVSAVIAIAVTLLLNIQKYVLMVITAVAGANVILLSGLVAFGRVTLEELQAIGNLILPITQDSVFWLIVWLALAVLGVVFQIRTNRTYVFTKETYVENWG